MLHVRIRNDSFGTKNTGTLLLGLVFNPNSLLLRLTNDKEANVELLCLRFTAGFRESWREEITRDHLFAKRAVLEMCKLVAQMSDVVNHWQTGSSTWLVMICSGETCHVAGPLVTHDTWCMSPVSHAGTRRSLWHYCVIVFVSHYVLHGPREIRNECIHKSTSWVTIQYCTIVLCTWILPSAGRLSQDESKAVNYF